MFTARSSSASILFRYVVGATILLLLLSSEAFFPAVAAGSSVKVDTTAVPTRAKKFLIRGMTEAFLGDHKEAVTQFEAALEAAPSSPVLHLSLADAHAAQGHYTTALFYAKRALRYGQKRPTYYERLAQLQQQAGNPRAALHTYRDLLNHFPGEVGAYQALAHLESSLDRPREALATYDALLARMETPAAKIYKEKLSLYRRVGDSSAVQKTLEHLIELRPGNKQYPRQLARLYAQDENYEAALTLLRSLVDAYPDDQSLRKKVQQLSQKMNGEEGSTASQPGGPTGAH